MKFVIILTASSALFSFSVTAATEYSFGGAIKSLLIHDSDVAGAGANIPGNSLYGKPSHSDTKFDASLSQIRFSTTTTSKKVQQLDTNLVLDFNANNDSTMSPRVREVYLKWNIGNGALTTGKTWSTFMDLKNIPESIAEATLSGVAFKRQPLVKWTQEIGLFKYELALESGTNDNIQYQHDQVELDTSGAAPNVVSAIEFAGQRSWLRATTVFSEVRYSLDDKSESDLGYGVQVSGGWNIFGSDKVTLLTYTGKGTEQYLLGLSGVGPTWNPKQQQVELTHSLSMMASYVRQWNSHLKSVLAYGAVSVEEYDWQHAQQYDAFTNTSYGMANLLWKIEPNFMLGIEYNYSQYKRSLPSKRDNHRFIIGINWTY